jgi:hypothetical protein
MNATCGLLHEATSVAARGRIFVLLLLAVLLCGTPVLQCQASDLQKASANQPPTPADPDKASSELNHHIAGWLLVAIGVMVICGHRYKALAFIQRLWPLLFVFGGIFLAVWSDREIWPRGDLGWTWLVHDREALQHKIYAFLLIAIGATEYLRARSRLNRRWAPWIFPVLAIFGGVFLFFHEHGGEATPVSNSGHPTATQTAQVHLQHDVKAEQPTGAAAGGNDHSQHQHATVKNGSPSMPVQPEAQTASTQPLAKHEHHMTPVMLNIKREHVWFAAVGFCVALCKFFYDAKLPRKRPTPYLWANSVILLGILLIFYTE